LRVRQAKTGKALDIQITGELEQLVDECLAEPVVRQTFVHRADGKRYSYGGLSTMDVGTAPRPRVCLQFSGCQPLGTSLALARDAGDPDSINRGADAASIQSGGSRPVNRHWLAASALDHCPAKQRFTSKGCCSLSMW